MACGIRNPDGSACLKQATHHWGTVEFCCDHFDAFVWGSIIPERPSGKPQHIDIVEEYNLRTAQSSLIDGSTCDAEKKRKP
jgi:hypothetical protein